MAMLQKQKWCKFCQRPTLHGRNTFSGSVGCLLSVITAGIFIPIWLVIGVFEALTVPWVCQACGRRSL